MADRNTAKTAYETVIAPALQTFYDSDAPDEVKMDLFYRVFNDARRLQRLVEKKGQTRTATEIDVLATELLSREFRGEPELEEETR